jgi:hypothetical protein
MAPVAYKEKIREARRNGYSDAEIIKYLAATDPKVKDAVDTGYKPTEILNFISPPKKAAPRNRGTGIGAIDTTLDVINEALIGIPEGAYNAAAMITDPISSLIFGDDVVKQAQTQRKKAVDTVARKLTTQPRPVAREIGRMVGPVAGVTRAANLAAPILQKAPVVGNTLARIAAATGSGGVGSGRTAAQTAKLTRFQRAKQLGERSIGGGISGATTAGLMGEDVSEGAGYGAGLPVVLNILKRIGSPVADFFRPGYTMAKGKAAEILRRAFADDIDAVRAEFAKLSPDDKRMAERFLVDVKIEPRAVFGIGKAAQEQTETGANIMGRKLESEAAARTASLADISGGADATARRQAIDLGRSAVSATTTPIREAALQRRGPVAVDPIVTALRSQADSEGIKTSAARGALLRLAKNIENGADTYGFISPDNLYTIRKEAGDTIEKLVSSKQQPSSGSKKRTAGIVIGFKNIVDNALGPDFKNYLTRHREGMSVMDRQELAAEAANLADTSSNQFTRLMRGGRDATVDDVMGRGTNQYDIRNLEITDPRRYAALTNAAKDFEALDRIDVLRNEGVGAAGKVIRNETPNYITRGFGYLMNTPAAPIAVAAEGARRAQTGYLMPRVEKELVNAFASAPRMGELIDTFPARQIASEEVSRAPAGVRNVMAQQFGPTPTLGAEFNFPDFEPESGEPLIDIDFSEGYPVPIYGTLPKDMRFKSLNAMRR